MKRDHIRVVHLVDMITGENQGILRGGLLDGVHILVDRVGRSLIPVLGNALLRRDDLDIFVELAREKAPALIDMAIEAHGLVLREDEDLANVGIDAVGEREVDDPIDSAERHGRLGAVARQGFEPASPTSREHNRHHVAKHQFTSRTRFNSFSDRLTMIDRAPQPKKAT